jgi:hypothetical protein
VSAEPAPAGPVESGCPLCGAPVSARDDRCPSCGMSLAGVGGRPGPFARRALWIWAGALLAIYLVVLVVVAAVHD